MKDRFRFRVWNIKEKEMIYNAEIAYDGMNYNTDWQLGDNQNDGWVDCFGYYLDYEHKDYEIMQFTGLKDKNDTLIYEGDILKQPDGIIDYVYWSDGCYIHNGTAITNYDICYQGDTWAKEVNTHEVIGNIYENEELLEDN